VVPSPWQPGGPITLASDTGYGHYDHVHITTTGGGYPSGGEEYLGDEGQAPAS